MAAQEIAVQNSTSRIKRFIREVRAELRKVSWPNKKELVSYTGIVFLSVVIVATMIWVMDAALTEVLRIIMK